MSRMFIALAVAAATLIAGAGVADAQQTRLPAPIRVAPGTDVQNVQVHSVDLAQAGRSIVDLEIVTACVDGVATFKIANKGEAWPRLGTLNVFKVADDGLRTIAKRDMRFASGQQASFRLKKAKGETIGLFVQPTWYERPFEFDAQVSCN